MDWKAFVVTRTDSGVDARVQTLGDDDLDPGGVLIDVEWSAVNYKDAMVTVPGNRVARRSPLVPGVDLAGVVAESDDPSVRVGTAVVVHGYDLGVARHGGFAQRARVPADWVVPMPEGMTARQAVTIGTAGFTAVLSMHALQHAGVEAGSGPVLVTGATGGVGSMAVAALARQGYEVVASTGKLREHDYLRALGAAEVVGREALETEPGRVLGDQRWAGSVDCVGGATLASVLRTLRYRGAVAASGLTAGTDVHTTVYPFIVRAVSLIGIDSVATPIGERRRVWASIADALPGDVVESMVSAEVGLDGVARVLAEVLAAQVRGRVLVAPRATASGS